MAFAFPIRTHCIDYALIKVRAEYLNMVLLCTSDLPNTIVAIPPPLFPSGVL